MIVTFLQEPFILDGLRRPRGALPGVLRNAAYLDLFLTGGRISVNTCTLYANVFTNRISETAICYSRITRPIQHRFTMLYKLYDGYTARG